MKYRLKDRALQEALEKVFPKFTEEFQEAAASQTSDESDYIAFNVSFGNAVSSTIRISKCDIEAVREYDPHQWTLWPAVTPPEMTSMRLEAKGRHYAAFYDGEWRIDGTGEPIFSAPAFFGPVRFRPWEDPE